MRRSGELISLCDEIKKNLYGQYENMKDDPAGIFVSSMLLKRTRTFRATRLLYMKGLEEQAQVLVRVLFELSVDLRIFGRHLCENYTDALQRVLDSMILTKAQQARESKYLGFDTIGANPQDIIDDEAAIKLKYVKSDIDAMRRHGFSGLPFRRRAELVQAKLAYDPIYRNFSRNVHSTDYMEHIRLLGLKSNLEEYEDLRNDVGFSAATTFTWEIAYLATEFRDDYRKYRILYFMMLIKLERIRVKLRRINGWVDLPSDSDSSDLHGDCMPATDSS